MIQRFLAKVPVVLLTLIVGLMTSSAVFGSATIVIQNTDSAGVGFNDSTSVPPIGGNAGTTLGQQRLNAFQFAANVWGATLSNGPIITIRASWANLPCTQTAGTLASTSVVSLEKDFANAPFPGTWYSVALANNLSGSDQNGSSAEIDVQINVRVGTPTCLQASPWYLGFDNNHGDGADLVTVLIHEFAHGLGFQTFTNGATGVQASGFPSIYDRFLFDNSTGKTWVQMTNAERAASATNTGHLTWNGSQVIGDVPNVLGTPRLRINFPPAIGGNYQIGTAEFGPPLSSPGITDDVIRTSPADGCSAVSGNVFGKIAFIDRGTCNFTVKVKNAQDAGAVGVIIGNVASSPNPGIPPGMSGSDPTITIPAVSVSLSDGDLIRARLGAGVTATIFLDHSAFSGVDSSGRPLMFAPSPFSGGSSVSHWDTSLFPNQLLEPDISGDLTHSVTPPQDLTFSLLRDIGWTGASVAQTIQFSQSGYSVSEGAGHIDVTVTRSGDTSGAASVDYKTTDTDTFTVGCSDTVNNMGGAYGRCDYSTSVDTLNFAAGETTKTFAIPIIDDSLHEVNETFNVVLSNATGAGLGTPATTTITIIDNDPVTGPNPIFNTPFFVRQHYLDFLSREPEVGEPWTAVLNNCSDVNNNPLCDRLTVSAAFFGSPEFQLKGFFVYRFYKLAFNRLPLYSELIPDMRAVTGQTPAEVFQKKAAFTNAFVQRAEFATLALMPPDQYVSTLMGRYSLTQITTPDPAAPDGTNKVTLTTAQLQSQLGGGTLTRAQVLRAIADSDQVSSLEFNQAFVAMQYYGYLCRTPDTAGYNSWLDYLNTHPTDSRTMVNGFMNSAEYRLRFGPP
jgi:PA domain/Calx-beta domain/Domain of unknown function (DUF4214)